MNLVRYDLEILWRWVFRKWASYRDGDVSQVLAAYLRKCLLTFKQAERQSLSLSGSSAEGNSKLLVKIDRFLVRWFTHTADADNVRNLVTFNITHIQKTVYNKRRKLCNAVSCSYAA